MPEFSKRQRELIQKRSEYLGFETTDEYMKFYVLMDALENIEEEDQNGN